MPLNAPSTGSPPHPHHATPETIKDTLISIMIAFTMAFVFRGFVVEAFVIPTGSMAPTLMGAHLQMRSPETGLEWPLGAWKDDPQGSTNYTDPQPKFSSQDPITGTASPEIARRTYSGDRILVLKYLYALQEPKRFDVIVFKNPTNPADNYIKRLIGLPGEQIALADGDVFVRTDPSGQETQSTAAADRARLWEQTGWKIQRKDPITQRSVWQLVYDSGLAPPQGAGTGPWRAGDPAGWSMSPREYRFEGSGKTELVWDRNAPRSSAMVPRGRAMDWEIDDYYPYDESYYLGGTTRFPVSDVRLRCGFEPKQEGQSVGMILAARGHEFRASIGAGKVEVAIREPVGVAGALGDWKVVTSTVAPSLAAGKVSNIEFWHVDQSVQVWLNGERVAEYDYDWSPGARISFAAGRPLATLLEPQSKDAQGRNRLADPSIYEAGRCTSARFAFDGGAFSLYRVGLDRDLHYQPASKQRGNGVSALGTSPYAPLVLSPDQYFACGDNSPASLDGRLWESVDPWINEQFPSPNGPYARAGVIHRDLLLGKAFFVYWPSLKKEASPVPVPDFGRMRFIW